MRLPCAPHRASRALRTPSALALHGSRRWQHSATYDAAVLGAGITGLTAAYRLSRDPKCSRVTLYEKTSEVGGWIKSDVRDANGGKVVFEEGPRTLRTAIPTCLPLLDLIFDLGLENDILMTEKSAPAALNRYIYYPDHLVRMPSPNPNMSVAQNVTSILSTILREPVFESFISGVLLDPVRPPSPPYVLDESVAEFVSRRFSPRVAENLVSALYHGIYAGDINQLSAQALLGKFRNLEFSGRGVIGGMIDQTTSGIKSMFTDDLLALEAIGSDRFVSIDSSGSYLKSLSSLVRKASVITFKEGMSELPNALNKALCSSDNVQVLDNTNIKAITRDTDTSDITIHATTGDGETVSRKHNRVISTIAPSALGQALNTRVNSNQMLPEASIRHLLHGHSSVSVNVVNLWYDNPDLLPMAGFGYLIPQSIPFEQNPERALGVIFGSDSSPGQDTVPGTKLTVMMGGHWWDGWTEADRPDEKASIDMACSVLNRHLGITETPKLVACTRAQDAIPQYTVGHLQRMRVLSDSVRHEFNNRLTLAGAWYNGVGVVDCVRQGYMAASYGVGALRVLQGDGDRPWRKFDYQNWVLEGGIPTSPIPHIDVYGSERRHF
ncbi:protoporphyrinogen oxidase [Aspergillus terreus]|uniref:Protoporphyrinogen oxidase n=1 Tax=Aspergillus terreus TaxID=33178 RepID=A0A5M3Z4A4_ASPTE|nr:hypothetical protein ATETN484_0009019700 [Aspergillus terreus]GFF17648.1 protoporphyrinogen oxidase [Aspergillus terreus]